MAMGDKNKADDEAQTDAVEAGPVGGECLARARRAQELSVAEIAKELHVDEPKVRALERNDFDQLGAAVFAKGYMRKYADIVGVDYDAVLADYYRLTRGETTPPVVLGRRRSTRELSPGPWIAAIIIALAVVAGYWWIANRALPGSADTPPASPASEIPPIIERAPVAAADETPTARLEISPDPDEPVADANDSATLAPAEEARDRDDAAESVMPAANPRVRLALSFSGECWTEISDATGRRLFFGMGQDGRNVELIGVAPISALFGNADNVRIWVDGEPLTIPADRRRGRVAQLEIMRP